MRVPDKMEKMTPARVTTIKAALGTLLWVAIQTAPTLCARISLIHSECAEEDTSPRELVVEINEMIEEAKSPKYTTIMIHSFQNAESVKTWEDLGPIGFGDGSEQNRPRGGSTGGAFLGIGSMDILGGESRLISPILWKSWRLDRVSRSSDDAEIQSITEAENRVCKLRILWTELNGHNHTMEFRYDALRRGRISAEQCRAILAVDSRGAVDAVFDQESANLGLKSSRAAIEAFALKQCTEDERFRLAWVK